TGQGTIPENDHARTQTALAQEHESLQEKAVAFLGNEPAWHDEKEFLRGNTEVAPHALPIQSRLRLEAIQGKCVWDHLYALHAQVLRIMVRDRPADGTVAVDPMVHESRVHCFSDLFPGAIGGIAVIREVVKGHHPSRAGHKNLAHCGVERGKKEM